MATISTLAIKTAMHVGPIVAGAKAMAAVVNDTTTTILPFNDAVKHTSTVANAASDAIDEATSSIKGYVAAAVGAASVTAMLANSVREYAATQTEADTVAVNGVDALGRANEVTTLAESWGQLTAAVSRANTIIGGAFAATANLGGAMNVLKNIVVNLTGILATLAGWLGSIFNFFANGPPILAAFAVAIKAVAVALGVLAQILITRAIVGMITYMVLGTAMTPMQLAWAAASYVASTATTILAGAVWLLNVALGVLAAIGAPIWITIGLAIAAVVVVAAALYALYQLLAGSDPVADKEAQMKALGEKTREAVKSAHDLSEALEKKIRQFSMTDKEKEMEDYNEKLQEVRNLWGDTVANELLDAHGKLIDQLDALEAAKKAQEAADEQRKERSKALMDIDNEWYARNLSDIEKKALALKKLGATIEEVARATEQMQQIEDQKKADEDRKTLAQQIADIEKQAAEFGKTDLEKRLAAAQALGASEAEILRIKKAGQEIEAREAGKKKADEVAKRVTEHAKEAAKMKEMVDGPMGAYKKKLEDIERLRKVGAISADVATRAEAAARKDLMDSMKDSSVKLDSSPKALLKGSAEAELATNRAGTPIEKLTALQKQQLSEAEKARRQLEEINKKTQEDIDWLVGI